MSNISAVRVRPVFKCCVLVIEEILGHFLRCLSLDSLGVAADASIVDQDIKVFLPRFYLFYQLLDAVLRSDVANKRDYFTGDILAVGFDDVLEFLFCTANYVDLGTYTSIPCQFCLSPNESQPRLTVDSKSLDTHETYATSSSSDESDLSLLVKHLRYGFVISLTLPLTLKTLASSKSALLVLDMFAEVAKKYVLFCRSR